MQLVFLQLLFFVDGFLSVSDINLIFGMLEDRSLFDHIGEIILKVPMVSFGLLTVQTDGDLEIVKLN